MARKKRTAQYRQFHAAGECSPKPSPAPPWHADNFLPPPLCRNRDASHWLRRVPGPARREGLLLRCAKIPVDTSLPPARRRPASHPPALRVAAGICRSKTVRTPDDGVGPNVDEVRRAIRSARDASSLPCLPTHRILTRAVLHALARWDGDAPQHFVQLGVCGRPRGAPPPAADARPAPLLLLTSLLCARRNGRSRTRWRSAATRSASALARAGLVRTPLFDCHRAPSTLAAHPSPLCVFRHPDRHRFQPEDNRACAFLRQAGAQLFLQPKRAARPPPYSSFSPFSFRVRRASRSISCSNSNAVC